MAVTQTFKMGATLAPLPEFQKRQQPKVTKGLRVLIKSIRNSCAH